MILRQGVHEGMQDFGRLKRAIFVYTCILSDFADGARAESQRRRRPLRPNRGGGSTSHRRTLGDARMTSKVLLHFARIDVEAPRRMILRPILERQENRHHRSTRCRRTASRSTIACLEAPLLPIACRSRHRPCRSTSPVAPAGTVWSSSFTMIFDIGTRHPDRGEPSLPAGWKLVGVRLERQRAGLSSALLPSIHRAVAWAT